MKYLEKWSENLLSQPSLTIKRQIKVKGICKKHLGPRLEYAVIELAVTPSDYFDVEFSDVLTSSDGYSKELLNSAVYGILDVIMVAMPVPLKNIKIRILNADIHPIDSNISAFRKAGRDAGRKIIEAVERQ